MNFGIIAAGEGSRLVNEGIQTPKPLVRLNGETLLERLIRIFLANNATSISIIINEEMSEVREHLAQVRTPVPLHVIIKSTPSSLHSFYELAQHLGTDEFCVTTVDTIFKEDEFADYIRRFEELPKQSGLMAVTPFVDDEKPLYVATDSDMQILSFEDMPQPHIQYISGGIYGLTANVFPTLKRCIESNIHRMRNFQREMIADHIRLYAHPIPKIIDIDHAEDIQTAGRFVAITN